MGIKSGRPRLETREGFKEAFATLLPYLRAGDVSQGEAARQLGISVRSLKRYVVRASGGRVRLLRVAAKAIQ